MNDYRDIIIAPVITEKAAVCGEENKVVFKVVPTANKVQIKQAVEKIFNVKVVAIRTINVHRKAKRMQRYQGFKPAYKKAIVRLAPGQTIDAFEL